jgi:hypothetical protein
VIMYVGLVRLLSSAINPIDRPKHRRQAKKK